MGERTEDGKIRIRCPGCSRRVKFPAGKGGETYVCPLCHHVIVCPVEDPELTPPTIEELNSITPPLPLNRRPSERPAERPVEREREDANLDRILEHITGETPAKRMDIVTREPVLKQLNAFFVRESERIGKLGEEVLADTELSAEQQTERLHELRRAKSFRFRKYVEGLLKDVDGEIAALRDNPASETQTLRQRLNALVQERRGLLLYLNVMFEIRTTKAAAPGTPGTAGAPPTTPSTPGAQTPRSKPAAGPGPGGIAP